MIIGLTGGIGSGKTTVSDLFSAKNITVVDADVVSRQVVEPGTDALKEIARHFGSQLIDPNGELNRRALRHEVFNNENERKWLEQLLHPLIREEIKKQLVASQSPYSILVSPLLLETNQKDMVERILLIDAPTELQISRTVHRDQTNAGDVKAILATQMTRQERQAKADDIITNDRDLCHLQQEVNRLHQLYLSL